MDNKLVAPPGRGCPGGRNKVEIIKEERENMKDLHKIDREFFDEAFGDCPVPADIRTAAERIVRAYGIRGICDPLYIANIIAKETGRGDGLSHFCWD